jgi:hypothetical protein
MAEPFGGSGVRLSGLRCCHMLIISSDQPNIYVCALLEIKSNNSVECVILDTHWRPRGDRRANPDEEPIDTVSLLPAIGTRRSIDTNKAGESNSIHQTVRHIVSIGIAYRGAGAVIIRR